MVDSVAVIIEDIMNGRVMNINMKYNMFQCVKCSIKVLTDRDIPNTWIALKDGQYSCNDCKDSIPLEKWKFKKL